MYRGVNRVLGWLGYRLMPLSQLAVIDRFHRYTVGQLDGDPVEVVDVLIFSRNRAMQLDALLTSMEAHVTGVGKVCILDGSDLSHQDSYAAVSKRFPDAGIYTESKFRHDVVAILEHKLTSSRVLLLCDDMFFIRRFNLRQVEDWLNADGITGLLKHNDDPPYPLGLGGFIYNRRELLALFASVDFSTPNQLELAMQQVRPMFDSRPCWTFSDPPCAAIECNTVQKDFVNATHHYMSPDGLRDMYMGGYRVHLLKYAGGKPSKQVSSMGLVFKMI